MVLFVGTMFSIFLDMFRIKCKIQIHGTLSVDHLILIDIIIFISEHNFYYRKYRLCLIFMHKMSQKAVNR